MILPGTWRSHHPEYLAGDDGGPDRLPVAHGMGDREVGARLRPRGRVFGPSSDVEGAAADGRDCRTVVSGAARRFVP